METLITAIVSIIAGAIINEIIRHFAPAWVKNIKNSLPKKASSRLRLKIVIKYPFLIAAACLTLFLIPEGKWLCVSLFSLSIIFSFFISRDLFVYLLNSINSYLDKSYLEKELEKWTNQLAICDRNNKERIEMLKKKIQSINNDINNL